MINKPYLVCLVAGLILAPITTSADDQPESINTSIIADNQKETYRRCLIAAEISPEDGLDMARRWIRLQGGEPAEHCAAAALIGLGDPEEAARRMETLANQSNSMRMIKSGLLGHAARAWMEAVDYDSALRTLNQAIDLFDQNSDLFLDRALCHAALGDLWATVDDLNHVIDIQPTGIDALVLRGSAYRQLDIGDLAKDDIERVLAVEPDNFDALLEKGLLARNSGDKTQARKIWVRVLELAPESAAGDAVRKHLESMD